MRRFLVSLVVLTACGRPAHRQQQPQQPQPIPPEVDFGGCYVQQADYEVCTQWFVTRTDCATLAGRFVATCPRPRVAACSADDTHPARFLYAAEHRDEFIAACHADGLKSTK